MSTESHGISRYGAVAVIRLKNLMQNQDAVGELKKRLRHLIEGTDRPRIVLDMEEVSSISSLMLGVIMALNLRIRRQRGQLRLCNLSPDIQVAFALVKIDSIIPIDSDVDDAVEAINGAVEDE